jgi:hypothetical protein
MYLYFVYGRAKDPNEKTSTAMDHSGQEHHSHDHGHSASHHSEHTAAEHAKQTQASSHAEPTHATDPEHGTGASHSHHDPAQKHEMSMHDIHMHDMGGPPRPLWATILIGVSHCGAGCVIGDLVGEWLVFGTGITINGRDIWPCLLLDYGFALLFGIIFQYFSIAPMSGEYGLKTVVRAAKADILSLTAFEVGLFGWMVAYQAGIWNYRLMMNTWVYWWMMQVGMFIGAGTAAPMNWWLITRNIKEPCA